MRALAKTSFSPSRKLTGLPVAVGLLALSALVTPALADNTYWIGNISFANGSESDNLYYNNPNNPGGAQIEDANQGTGELTFAGNYTAGYGGAIGNAVTLDVWCIDVYHNVNLGGNNSYYESYQGLNTDNSGNYGGGGSGNPGTGLTLSTSRINEMSWLVMTGTEYLDKNPGDSTASGAYQLAIWEAEYAAAGSDNGQNFTASGNSGLESVATSLLDDAETASAGCKGAGGACWWDNGVFRLDSSYSQGFAYWNGAVPEPGSLGLLGGALLGLAGMTFLRRRNQGTQI